MRLKKQVLLCEKKLIFLLKYNVEKFISFKAYKWNEVMDNVIVTVKESNIK